MKTFFWITLIILSSTAMASDFECRLFEGEAKQIERNVKVRVVVDLNKSQFDVSKDYVYWGNSAERVGLAIQSNENLVRISSFYMGGRDSIILDRSILEDMAPQKLIKFKAWRHNVSCSKL